MSFVHSGHLGTTVARKLTNRKQGSGEGLPENVKVDGEILCLIMNQMMFLPPLPPWDGPGCSKRSTVI